MRRKRIGYTTGVFDLFHIGHLNIIRRSKQECDYLIVGITTDALACELKGRRPAIPFDERIEIVRAIRYVDEAIPETTADKMVAWQKLKFDVLFKGDDWKGTQKWKLLEKECSTVGVEVVYFPYTKRTSSTIIRKILESECEVLAAPFEKLVGRLSDRDLVEKSMAMGSETEPLGSETS